MEVRNYGQDKGRTFCTEDEFMDECKKTFQFGDMINSEQHEEGEALVYRNSAKCMLAMWFVDSHEYRTF